MKTTGNSIKGFDGMRAAAVSAVILTHMHVHRALIDKEILPEGIVRSISGSAGVQGFFILSGFLITHLLIAALRSSGQVSLRNFYLRRSLRILPVYLLVVTAALAMEVMFGQVASYESFLYAYTYTYNFVPKEVYSPVLGHTWSLAVEEHFYLVWPFIFAGLAARWSGLLVMLAVFIPAAILLHIGLDGVPWLKERYHLSRWSFFAGVNIALGCLGALLMNRAARPRLLGRLTTGHAGLAVGIILWFAEALPLMPNHLAAGYLRGLGLLIIIGWIFANQESYLVRLLELRPVRYVGAISYGLYMYQGLYLATGPYRAPDQVWPPDQAVGLVLLLVTAPLSYHLLERPIVGLKHRYQRRVHHAKA
jgi:peptidoglycan/LPS O-acetylase OafA/YrhL